MTFSILAQPNKNITVNSRQCWNVFPQLALHLTVENVNVNNLQDQSYVAVIDPRGITADPNKTAAIQQMETLKLDRC